jgi:hypothetical protein
MQITCSKCKVTTTASVDLEVLEFACPNCKTLFRKNNEGNLIKQFEYAPKHKATLYVGQKGKLQGKEYFVTGVIVKKIQPKYYWREYILTAADGTKRFLSETDGHWILLEEITDTFKGKRNPNGINYEGNNFALYEEESTTIDYAEGFFDYALPAGKQTMIEYINPPYIISIERDGSGDATFYGRHIDNSTIKKAFNVPVMPLKSGTGIVQPFWLNVRNTAITFCGFSILILLSHLFIYNGKHKKEVFADTLSFSDFNNKDFVSKSFTLQGGSAPMTVSVQSSVDNSWASVQVGLVNEITNEEVYATKDIEYYHGYTEGENWTEGSTNEKLNICGVAAGRYHFVITPQKPPEDTKNNYISLKAGWDEPSMWNAMLPIILMIVVTIIAYYLSVAFERKRWQDSSYSNYN